MELRRLIIKEEEGGAILEVSEERLCNVKVSAPDSEIDDKAVYISTRGEEEFKGKAIFLPKGAGFDWVLGKDSVGSICLVPLKKGKEENV